MSVDDRLRRGLNEIAPADPSGVYERIVEKKVRRSIVRRAQVVVLALAVLAGSVVGFGALSRVWIGDERLPIGSESRDGVLAVALFSEAPAGIHIATIDVSPIGSVPVALPIEGRVVTEPAWSPDGTEIAFWLVANEPEDWGLYVTTADGRDTRAILHTRMSIHAIRWSPDGTEVAFIGETISKRGGPESDADIGLYTARLDGTGSTRVTQGGQVWDFDWSPDGQHFVIERQFGAGDRHLRTDLAIIGADGTEEKVLTSDGTSGDPAWSPDGSTIVFVGGSAPRRDLFEMSSDGASIVRLTDDEATEEDPTWSPSGSRLAFVRFPNGDGTACEIVVAGRHGSSPTTIGDKESLGGCPVALAWQPLTAGDAPVSTTASSDAGEPSPTDMPSPGRDIGLPFRLCDVQTLHHVDFLGDATDGAAWTGAPVTDAGGCPKVVDDTYVVAVDYTGDGLADDAWRALPYCVDCEPYAATDLDADGNEELVVLAQGGTTPEFDVFDVSGDGGPRLRPIVVAAPGDPDAGFPAGEPARIWTGGDEGFTGVVTCPGYPERPEILVGWADGPVDGPGSDTREVHVTRFALQDGVMHVLDSQRYTHPSRDPLPYPFTWDGKACGIDWNPFH